MDHIEVFILLVGELERLLQKEYWHVSEQPDVEDEEMNSIDDELVHSNVPYPAPLLQQQHEDPRRNH